MSQAIFDIIINGIKTTTVNGLVDVVKQVEWTMVGSKADQTFELPHITMLGDPATDEFIQLSELTSEAVVGWIEATDTRLEAIKAHVQYVLDKQVATAALTIAHMPWMPAPEALSTGTDTSTVVTPVV